MTHFPLSRIVCQCTQFNGQMVHLNRTSNINFVFISFAISFLGSYIAVNLAEKYRLSQWVTFSMRLFRLCLCSLTHLSVGYLNLTVSWLAFILTPTSTWLLPPSIITIIISNYCSHAEPNLLKPRMLLVLMAFSIGEWVRHHKLTGKELFWKYSENYTRINRINEDKLYLSLMNIAI